MPIIEISIEDVLKEMDFTMDMFIDMCILLGCDYCDPIKGIGPKKAVELIKKYKSIDEIIKNLDQKKYPLPEKFPYEEVRELFKHPEVEDPAKFDLKWGEVDAAGLKEFLVTEKGFNEQRVDAGIAKLLKAQKKVFTCLIDYSFSWLADCIFFSLFRLYISSPNLFENYFLLAFFIIWFHSYFH